MIRETMDTVGWQICCSQEDDKEGAPRHDDYNGTPRQNDRKDPARQDEGYWATRQDEENGVPRQNKGDHASCKRDGVCIPGTMTEMVVPVKRKGTTLPGRMREMYPREILEKFLPWRAMETAFWGRVMYIVLPEVWQTSTARQVWSVRGTVPPGGMNKRQLRAGWSWPYSTQDVWELTSVQNGAVGPPKHDEGHCSPRPYEEESLLGRIMETVLPGRMAEMTFLCRIIMSHSQ